MSSAHTTGPDKNTEVDYGSADQDQIQLVLRILAMLCDGQNSDLQNYLRDQPDNPKSFDVLSDVTALIGSVYSCIDSSNIDLVIQTYDTLIEFASGNQANRMVLITNKIIDTINYILRTKSFRDCSQDKIIKDSSLQKINFRVPNKIRVDIRCRSQKILREEVKEIVKWNVNRTSASERIRDFIAWSREILIDVRHQRTILNNKLAAFLTRNWLIWNKSVILVSLVINTLMLLTWQAPMALEEVPKNTTDLPNDLYDPKPVIRYSTYYQPIVLTLGIIHNLMTFVVLRLDNIETLILENMESNVLRIVTVTGFGSGYPNTTVSGASGSSALGR
ncbi:hypothetical protein LSH36_859g02036 [Paralvinella palmiformis]|uniref:RyR/IP3R Homology associated domain-containing protein n=1 Tax=Paralvinella palmiformis TaxID=53620 RepID=A0AAD9J074_9ANNE|nr:hypothetical protein LSH36_859g02036 [Paralvinella palmiformis]